MRIKVEFEGGASQEVMLGAVPPPGARLNLNGLTYNVDTVAFDANPAPMRATDATLTVSEAS